MRIEVLSDLSGICPEDWDALTGDDDPFVEYGFLRALELSGSVGEDSGWQPAYVTMWDSQRLVGALPLYAKWHSYGEYIFDWAWADAAERAGFRYYPKLVSMVPFTPATGRRLLVAADQNPQQVGLVLLDGALELARELDVSSLHVLYLNAQERDVVGQRPVLMPRLSTQFHWHNQGYETFDEFVGTFRNSSRKQVKRERRRVLDSGLSIEVREGPELDDVAWDALHEFYRSTCRDKGSFPYLRPTFFRYLREQMAHRVVAVLARDGQGIVAGTLNFEKGKHLYGRYWGCREGIDGLHFELCYYQLIERAITRGLSRFEAGAQGSHKLRRGLMPRPIHSAHWVSHETLREAISEFLPREAHSVQQQMEELSAHGPFRR